MEIENRCLTIKEASEYLRIPVATLRLFRAQNRPPESFLLANRVMYDLDTLNEWIAECKKKTTRGNSGTNRNGVPECDTLFANANEGVRV